AVAAPGGARDRCAERSDRVVVVEVDGLIDPVLADLIEDQAADAAETCPLALVLQFDSGGAVISDGEMDDLVATIERSPVPVAVWVGPSGSKAADEAVRVLAAADLTGVSVGSSVVATTALLEARGLEPGDLGPVAVADRVGARRAVELDLVDNDAPTILTFVVEIDGFRTDVVDGERRPATEVAFTGLDVFGEVMHTVASPNVAYLLFVIGLGLLLFELFTAGVGIAGSGRAGALALGCYGLSVLPFRPVGVALLL